MKLTVGVVGVLLVSQALLVGCGDPGGHPFFDQPFEQRDSLLLEYSLEEQLAIYVEGVTRWHPPDIGLANPLARNGRPLIPILLDELQVTDSEALKVELLRVLGEMSCYYTDLSEDESVIQTAEREVSGMRNAYWQEFAEKQLARIRGEGCPRRG